MRRAVLIALRAGADALRDRAAACNDPHLAAAWQQAERTLRELFEAVLHDAGERDSAAAMARTLIEFRRPKP